VLVAEPPERRGAGQQRRAGGAQVGGERVERGQISKSIQCTESVCGDPGGDTEIGGKIYTTVIRPRTIGLRIGRTF